MSLKAMSWAWKAELPPSEKLTLLALADYHNDDKASGRLNQCNPSHKSIAIKTGLSKRTVERSTLVLQEKGFLKISPTRNGNDHLPNQYFLAIESKLLPDTVTIPTDTVTIPCRHSDDTPTDTVTIPTDTVTIPYRHSDDTPTDTVATNPVNNQPVINPVKETTTTPAREKGKKAVVAALEENHIKQTQEEVAKGQNYLDRFVNPEPYIDPNDIVLTDEQLGCYQWALSDLRFWREKMNGKEAFMTHYGKPNSALKHQYETWLLKQQAQKSLETATNNHQGSTKKYNEANYVTRAAKQPNQTKQFSDPEYYRSGIQPF